VVDGASLCFPFFAVESLGLIKKVNFSCKWLYLKKSEVKMRKLSLVLLTMSMLSCSQSKEQEVKKLMGMATDAVAMADKNPTFENLTAAGLSLSQANSHDKAISYFERAKRLQPKNALSSNNLCAEFNAIGQWDTAIKHCEEAITVNPSFQLAKNNLKYSKDKKAEQLKHLQNLKNKIASLQGKERQAAMVDLGFEYYKMGDYSEALSVWKKVAKSNDDIYARTLNNIGSAYIILKKFDLAKASLEEAARLQPQNQLVKNNMAWLNTEVNANKK
jgi:tetratricopeptide (TPR) repeat protein